MPSEELVEKWAIKLALGNNGGSWSCNMPFKDGIEPGVKDLGGVWGKHYTEDQRNFWRALAHEVLVDAEVANIMDKSTLISESSSL
jgi:hypothetical protein